MSQDILDIIWAAIGVIITALVSWGSKLFIAWINTKIQDERIRKFVDGIGDIVQNSVKQIYQQFVEVLKKEGRFDATAQKEAKESCLNIINNKLTPEMVCFIKENYGDITSFLSDKIESVIYDLKNQNK